MRPNASLAPAFIDLDQLESGARACNALDALASHANSFAVQASYGSFFSRYALFSACGQAPPASAASAARCLELLCTAVRLDSAISTLAGGDILRSVSVTPQSSDSTPPPFVCGATTIFLSAPFYDALEVRCQCRSRTRLSSILPPPPPLTSLFSASPRASISLTILARSYDPSLISWVAAAQALSAHVVWHSCNPKRVA